MAATIRTRRRQLAYSGPCCPFCAFPVAPSEESESTRQCDGCQREYVAVSFVPPRKSVQVVQLSERGPEEALSCAHHEKNTAVASCERCGSFICGLCRIDADGVTLCPACFDRLSAEGALESTRNAYKDYTRMAAHLVVASFFLWFIGPLLGLIGIGAALKGIRQRHSSGGRVWTGYLVMFLCLVVIVGTSAMWAVFFFGVAMHDS